MAKKTKSQIAQSIVLELQNHFNVTHPHTQELIAEWLASKWNPAIESDRIAFPMDWKHWGNSGKEWTQVGYSSIVIQNTASGLTAWIDGYKIISAVTDQAWQDRLAIMSQVEANGIIDAPSLFPVEDYEKGEGGEGDVYTHEDG